MSKKKAASKQERGEARAVANSTCVHGVDDEPRGVDESPTMLSLAGRVRSKSSA